MVKMNTAPWSDKQIAALNRYQRDGIFHPFTCGKDRGNEAHRKYAEAHNDPDWGLLVATPDGWICPVCDYRQGWAHQFMVDWPETPPKIWPGDDNNDA